MRTMLENRPDGIKLITLENEQLKVILSNKGASIISIYCADRNGQMDDIVLGYEDIARCGDDTCYLGATVGRVANRIAKGCYSLNGEEYRAFVNNGPNSLHGGKEGFNVKLFDTELKDNSVIFTYLSPDGEEGYPGNLTLRVTYTIINNKLEIDYQADSDKDTIINITNHAYFNLSGGRARIYDHELRIKADTYACVDEDCLAYGELRPVESTPFDFRTFHKIGERIKEDDEQLKRAAGYDHSFILKDGNDGILLYDEGSGRQLAFSTSQPVVQIYTGNYLKGGCVGKKGIHYENGDGVAIEVQRLPNSINVEENPSVILRAGDNYIQHTEISFTTR